MSTRGPILAPGRNCERIAQARRVAWLIDGESYFDALASAIERAERSVLMLGWDFHSRMRLRRDDAEEEFVALLERVVRSKPRLQVRMLGWDFAMIYALEREFLPLEQLQRKTHRRIQFRLDDQHPPGASHHQKIVAIDDAIAFCGGLDVTVCRWDTSEHRAEDPRRSDPGFESYGPFHDVQLLVDGDAARALAEIARDRWRRATGRTLHVCDVESDSWPASVVPELRDVGVAITRTQPAHDDLPEVRHVERLYVDAIRAARHSIYLENQYFTSSTVVDALVERLGDAEAPEIVIVVPQTLSGWLEERTMGALMAHAVARLREADTLGRLRVYAPVLPGGAELTIHSKVMVVEDQMLRVGSANLSNRSMGLDTECDVAVESTSERDVRTAILRFRDTLLAEHLAARTEQVQQAVAEHGSLLRGIDALCRGARRFERVECPVDEIASGLVPPQVLFDPERPIPFQELQEQLVKETVEGESGGGGTLARVAAAVALPVALLAFWKIGPLADAISAESLSSAASQLDHGTVGALIGLLVFIAAALLFVPVVSLIVASAVVFGFVKGALIALAGSLLSASAGYALGRALWRDLVRTLAGSRLERLNEHLSRRGLVATAAVRIVPVAPFAVVNLVAGASRVGLRDFALGTAIGMAPGTAALAFFAEHAAAAVRDPSVGSMALAALGVFVLLALCLLMRRLSGREDAATEGES